MMDNNLHYEETIKSEKIYEGRVIKVRVDTVELSNMSYAKREIVEHQRSVVIIAMNDNDELYFVKQFRKPIDKVLLELPAGLVESSESLQEAAKRELNEEIGLKPKSLELLIEAYSSPGFTDEIYSVFLATECEEDIIEADEEENLEIVKINIDEAIEMIDNFEIMDAKTIIGILTLAKKLGKK